MSNVHSLRIIKMAQLHLRLADQLIKKRHPDIKIKLKTVTKIAYLTGSRFWLALDSEHPLTKKAS